MKAFGMLSFVRNLLAMGCIALTLSSHASADEVDTQIETVLRVEKMGAGFPEASLAIGKLSQAKQPAISKILKAFPKANPIAKNWLLGALASISRKEGLPTADLQKFLADSKNDPAARTWVFEQLTRDDAALKTKLLDGMTDDRSLELRYLAVKQAADAAAKLVDSDKPNAIVAYKRLFDSARHPDQLKEIAAKLKELGENVDLAKQYGFLVNWKLVGPFDNRNEAGFDVVYPPEKEAATGKPLAADKPYAGKEAKEAAWQPHTTESPEGAVDLNPIYKNEKGAIVYAYTEFDAAAAGPADIRLGCINANKVWVNGKLVLSNQVYHAATSIDQYIGKTELVKGKNTILVKVCQNEQTEPWAQDFQFQLRICDANGKAILATNR